MIKFLTLLVFITNISLGQFVNNPSFEGSPQGSTPPPSWNSCNTFSTPDTQPGSWNVTARASDGNTYISLVARGVNGEERDNTKEAIGIPFNEPLQIGSTYNFSIDLAYFKDFDDLWFFPEWLPLKLQIYVGNSECEKEELIWSSPKVSNIDWNTFKFDYIPSDHYNYLILEPDFVSGIYNGDILVDNLIITDPNRPKPKVLPSSKGCKLGIPNVFTPNSDGRNENFTIQYNSNVSRFDLKIYNRWGKLVFESNNIDAVWDGRNENGSEADSGVYFWKLTCFCIEDNSIKDDNLKGTISLIR